MGAWTGIAEAQYRFLSRARAMDFRFNGDEEAGMICPACQDRELPCYPCFVVSGASCDAVMTPENGRVLSCSHEICVDCLLQLRGAPITHDGQL